MKILLIIAMCFFAYSVNAQTSEESYELLIKELSELQIEMESATLLHYNPGGLPFEFEEELGEEFYYQKVSTQDAKYHILFMTPKDVDISKKINSNEDFEKILSEFNAHIKTGSDSQGHVVTFFDKKIESLIRKVIGMKEKFQNNPHVLIKGFDLNVALPPSINVAFEFKVDPTKEVNAK